MKHALLIIFVCSPFLIATGEKLPREVKETEIISTVTESDKMRMEAQEAARDKACAKRELYETIYCGLE